MSYKNCASPRKIGKSVKRLRDCRFAEYTLESLANRTDFDFLVRRDDYVDIATGIYNPCLPKGTNIRIEMNYHFIRINKKIYDWQIW